MKSLCQFIIESKDNDVIFLYEDIFNEEEKPTLEQVYEHLFDMMFNVNEGVINEGFFTKLGAKFAKLGQKAEELGGEIDSKISKASDAAKEAINTAKEKAGKAWDGIKDTYTGVVLAIDDAIKSSRKSIENICKNAQMKISDFESTCAQIYANTMAKGGEAAKAITDWMSDKTQGAQKIAALNALMLGAMMVKKAGISGDMAMDILINAGMK